MMIPFSSFTDPEPTGFLTLNIRNKCVNCTKQGRVCITKRVILINLKIKHNSLNVKCLFIIVSPLLKGPAYKMSLVMRKPVYAICEQQRRSSACASAQSDQHLYCSLPR